ncbi:hypothetical protein, partial [Streptomyces sp. NBC_00441]|uniref:hypothetical protein n=1 Tax=Streptomyces sp. NBC_00441 TaxID=2975742 RepID=UPI002E2C695F
MGFTPPNPSFEHQVQSLEMFARIAQESGPGEHHLTMCLVDDSEMVALHHAAFYERGRGVETNATALLDTCYMLAVGLSGKHRGGTFVRSLHKGQESIC